MWVEDLGRFFLVDFSRLTFSFGKVERTDSVFSYVVGDWVVRVDLFSGGGRLVSVFYGGRLVFEFWWCFDDGFVFYVVDFDFFGIRSKDL